jgi:hypothetical protein
MSRCKKNVTGNDRIEALASLSETDRGKAAVVAIFVLIVGFTL